MIWYSHVNEDSRPELSYCKGFQTLISVVGSGERVIALLNNSELKRIYVVDVNTEAIELLKLKLTALTELSIQDYLGFIGAKEMESDIRLNFLKVCLYKMDASSGLFWNQKLDFVGKGILFMGHFELFLSRIRPLLKLFLGVSFFKVFQNDYQNFPSLRWKIIKILFSNKLVYKIFGNKDISFIGGNADISIISNGIQELIDAGKLHHSFMAHLIFKGSLNEMEPSLLPPSQDPEILRNIQNRLRNKEFHITFENNDILNLLKEISPGVYKSKVFISMSDILSFETPEYIMNCVRVLSNYKNCAAAFVIRSYLKNHLNANDIFKIREMGYSVEDITNLDETKMYKVNLIRK